MCKNVHISVDEKDDATIHKTLKRTGSNTEEPLQFTRRVQVKHRRMFHGLCVYVTVSMHPSYLWKVTLVFHLW